MQTRRTLLKTIPLLALAGCIGTTGTTSNKVTPHEPNGNGKSDVGEFYYHLENPQGDMLKIDVVSLKYSGDTLYLEYDSQQQTFEEIATVISLYVWYVEGDGNGTRLKVTIVDGFGDPQGTYHAEESWAQAYLDEEVSWREYSGKVLDTLHESN